MSPNIAIRKIAPVSLLLVITAVGGVLAKEQTTESPKGTIAQKLPRVLPLPVNISLREFFEKELWPELKYLTIYPIVITETPKGNMYKHLRNNEKNTTARLFGFKNKDGNEIQTPLNDLLGKRIRFDLNETLIESANTQYQPKRWEKDIGLEAKYKGTEGRSMRGRLIVLTNYEHDKYLILKSPFTMDSLWFFPLNKRSMRFLGHFADKGFCDKSYHEYYESLVDQEKETPHPVGSIIWQAILKGYDPQQFQSLPRNQQVLIHDTIGIFLAEEFRLKSMDKQDELTQIIPITLFISTFLVGGGEPYGREKDYTKHKKIHHIPTSHRELHQVLKYYNKTITNYIKEKDPELYELLLKETSKLNTNSKNKKDKKTSPSLLEDMARLSTLKQDAEATKHTLQILDRLLSIIKRDAKNMIPQRDTGHILQR